MSTTGLEKYEWHCKKTDESLLPNYNQRDHSMGGSPRPGSTRIVSLLSQNRKNDQAHYGLLLSASNVNHEKSSQDISMMIGENSMRGQQESKEKVDKEATCESIKNLGADHLSFERAKLCSICGAICDRNHLNYGAVSCYSCRAFFRR